MKILRPTKKSKLNILLSMLSLINSWKNTTSEIRSSSVNQKAFNAMVKKLSANKDLIYTGTLYRTTYFSMRKVENFLKNGTTELKKFEHYAFSKDLKVAKKFNLGGSDFSILLLKINGKGLDLNAATIFLTTEIFQTILDDDLYKLQSDAKEQLYDDIKRLKTSGLKGHDDPVYYTFRRYLPRINREYYSSVFNFGSEKEVLVSKGTQLKFSNVMAFRPNYELQINHDIKSNAFKSK